MTNALSAEKNEKRQRLRELGIVIGRLSPGRLNAITDVAGVRVGHTTLIAGEGPLVVGQGPVRTGVSVILPHAGNIGEDPLFAGCHVLNGNGEMTGTIWIEESGLLTTPIALTNTHSVGVVRDALIAYDAAHYHNGLDFSWSLPVVAETWDGFLSDLNGFHVKPDHVWAALDSATDGPVAEGCVGGGTGMICHGFKGGIGTSSRLVSPADTAYTVGVLVQANYGQREFLRVSGVPVGQEIDGSKVPTPWTPPPTSAGSIIVVIATDAPLLPHQCRRLAQRASLGIGRVGGFGANSSGDIFLAFSTANRGMGKSLSANQLASVQMLSNDNMTPLFEAAVEATEEAILNALCMATTTTGINNRVAYALPLTELQAVMQKYSRQE